MTRKAYESPSTEMVYSEQTVLAGFTNAKTECKSPGTGGDTDLQVDCPGGVECKNVEPAKENNPWGTDASNPWSVWEDDEEE